MASRHEKDPTAILHHGHGRFDVNGAMIKLGSSK
jgi:hypothetical protein